MVTNSLIESQQGASSGVDCLSGDGTSDLQNNGLQRRDLFGRQTHGICRSNDKPQKGKLQTPSFPSSPSSPSSRQEIPPGNMEENTDEGNPCRSYLQLGSDSYFPEHITCGGPTVGEFSTLPAFVLNCVPSKFFVQHPLITSERKQLLNLNQHLLPDAAESIATRGFFSATDNVIEYCCVSHNNEVPTIPSIYTL